MTDKGLIYIQGRLYPKAVDKIAVSSEHVFDPSFTPDKDTSQQEINSTLKLSIDDIQNQTTILNTKLNVFLSGAKVTLSVDPTIVHTYTGDQNIILKGDLVNLDPKGVTLSIYDEDGVEIATVTDQKTIKHTVNINVVESDAISFSIKATVQGIDNYSIGTTQYFYMKDPIYSGCSAEDDIKKVIEYALKTDAWKHNPIKSLPTSYSSNVDKNADQYFYILVPQSLGTYKTFDNGQFAMLSEQCTVELSPNKPVAYTIYKSAKQQKGSSIKITAQQQ